MNTLLDSVLATRLTDGVAEAASADAMCVASLMDMLSLAPNAVVRGKLACYSEAGKQEQEFAKLVNFSRVLAKITKKERTKRIS